MANPVGTSSVPKTSAAEWTVREQLLLASAVHRSGDQNWVSVSRAVKPLMEEARPPEFFSPKYCATQYAMMLDKASTPKRKRTADGTPETVETVEEQIIRQLTEKRIKQLDRSLAETKEEYLMMKKEMELVEKGGMDDKLLEMAQALESASSKEQSSEDKVMTSSQQPEALNTNDTVQTTPLQQNHTERLKVEIKQELLSPSSSQRNSVQLPVKPPKTRDERTSQEEEKGKLAHEQPDNGERHVNQEEMDVCKTEEDGEHRDVNQEEMAVCKMEADSEIRDAEQEQTSTEKSVEAAVVQEPELSSNSISLPVDEEKGEEEKMEVDKDPKLCTQHEEEEVERTKEEKLEKVEEREMKSPKGDESPEHKVPAVMDRSPRKKVEQEEDMDEQSGEEKKVSDVPCENVLESAPASQDDAQPESVSMETSSVEPEVAESIPEKLSPVEEKQEEKESSLSVTSPDKEKQEPTEAPGHEVPGVECTQEEENKRTPTSRKEEAQLARKKQEKDVQLHEKKEEKGTQLPGKNEEREAQSPSKNEEKEAQFPSKNEEKEVQFLNKSEEKEARLPSKDEENEAQLPSKDEEKEAQLPGKNEEKEVQLDSKKEQKKVPLSSKKEDEEVQMASKEEKGVPLSIKKEKEDEVTEMEVEEGRQNSVEEKPLVKERKGEDEEEQAPSPRITRARRKEVSQTPEGPVRIVKAEVDTPRGRRVIKVIKRGRMGTRLSRQKIEPVVTAPDPETSVDSRDVTDQESEEEPASSISSAVPSPALSQSDPDHENLQAMRQWRKTIMLVWRHAAQHKYAALFLHPVKEEDAPGYHDVVLRPMDLSSIKKNIENGVIKTDTEFQREMLLMFQNALMYNSSDHDVYRMADEMRNDVMENIQEYLLTQMMVHSSGTKALRNRDSKKVESLEEKKKLHSEESTTTKKRRTRADD